MVFVILLRLALLTAVNHVSQGVDLAKPSWLSVNPLSPLALGPVTATSLQDGGLELYCLRCHFF